MSNLGAGFAGESGDKRQEVHDFDRETKCICVISDDSQVNYDSQVPHATLELTRAKKMLFGGTFYIKDGSTAGANFSLKRAASLQQGPAEQLGSGQAWWPKKGGLCLLNVLQEPMEGFPSSMMMHCCSNYCLVWASGKRSCGSWVMASPVCYPPS